MRLSEKLKNVRVVVDDNKVHLYPQFADEDKTEYSNLEPVVSLALKELRDNGRVYEAIKPECRNLDDNEIKIDVWAAKFKTEGGWYDIAHIYVPRCWR